MTLLRKDGKNTAQWLRQYRNGGAKYSMDGFHLKSKNFGVTLSEARHKDNATNDPRLLTEEIIRAARATGLVADDYNHDRAVKASSDSRTPRSKPGESETARKARGEKESEALALDELLQCLDDDDRTHYTGLIFYIDLETGNIESKERRQARGIL